MSRSHFRPRKARRWHRWVALATSIQLLLWTVSGIFFAFLNIDYVRGKHFFTDEADFSLDLSMLKPREYIANQVVFKERMHNEVIVGLMSEAGTSWQSLAGEPLDVLTSSQAISLVATRTILIPDTAEWVDQLEIGSEYRNFSMPLWRVYGTINPSDIAYVDAFSGEILAVRHEAWRWWDFLWSLHIMNYDDRDSIGTLALRFFSVLTFSTVILGLWLYWETRVR